MAISSSVSHSFSLVKKTLHDKHPVKSGALKGFLYLRVVKKVPSSLVMEGFDIFYVPEDGFLLAANFRWRIWTVCMLHVMDSEEVDIFYKLGFTSYQVLDQLAGGKDKLGYVICCSLNSSSAREDVVCSQ